MFKKKKIIFIVSVVCCLTLLFTGCTEEPAEKHETEKDFVSLTLFYPYDTGTDVAITQVTIEEELATDENPVDKIVAHLKNPPKQKELQLSPVLGPDVEILSTEMLDNQIVKVNVNRQFITQMNAGGSLEENILECFAKSIAAFYRAEGILLRVEGKPYESGHFAFSAEEIIR